MLASCVPFSTTSYDADHARRDARFDDVELRFIGRKRQAVGTVHVAGDDGQFLGIGLPAVHVGGQFRLGAVPFVKAEDAERRVGEPDRAVGFADDVVGRIERLAVVAIGDAP